MKTIDLTETMATLDELLAWASDKAVIIRAPDGHEFILEQADDLEREVAMLGGSEEFVRFLQARAQERGTIPIEDFEKTLG